MLPSNYKEDLCGSWNVYFLLEVRMSFWFVLMMILFLFISKLLRHYWSGPLPSVAFTFRLRLIFRLSTNEDGKSTSKSCCKQPKLILFFWIRILTVLVKKSKSWNHWRINLFGIKKACFFCTYHNPNFLYKMMQDSSHSRWLLLEVREPGKFRAIRDIFHI